MKQGRFKRHKRYLEFAATQHNATNSKATEASTTAAQGN